jgi:hypothetical protein
VQGVRDPLGGVNSLWPLFGIANQMLAAIALCLGTTIILKMQLRRADAFQGQASNLDVQCAGPGVGRPWLALVTLLPMIWLVSVTFTAGAQKVFHEKPRLDHPEDPPIGFLAQARVLKAALPNLQVALEKARAGGDGLAIQSAEAAVRKNRTLHFNNVLDAGVAGAFLALVGLVVLLSVREWFLLLAGQKLAELRESPPVWLPEYAVAEGRPFRLFGVFALLLGLARELSDEAQMERARAAAAPCACAQHGGPGALPAGKVAEMTTARPGQAGSLTREEAYLQTLELRFKGVRRCC